MASPVPVCIHCGSDEIRVTQTVKLTKTTNYEWEEDFFLNVNPCSGCAETDCCDRIEPGNRVYFEDDGDNRYDVTNYEGEVLSGSHPIINYEVADDDLTELDYEYYTDEVRFTTICCGITRSHVRELVRMEDGPATFDDNSTSVYSGNQPEGSKLEMITSDDLSGGLNIPFKPPGSEMDDVIASIADLP